MTLGYALEVPADKGGGRADYTAALDCYRAALEVFTPDRNRIEHDKTQRHLDRVIKNFADGRLNLSVLIQMSGTRPCQDLSNKHSSSF